MKHFFILFLTLALSVAHFPSASSFGIRTWVGISEPYYLAPGNGEPTNPPINSTGSVCDASGFTLDNTLTSPSTTLVLVTIGQSLIASSGSSTYTPVNTKASNFSVCDGGWYRCKNPVLGASYAPAGGVDSPNCRIADSLITAGTYTQVIVVPIAIGGTVVADWNSGGQLFQKIAVTMNRLKQRHLTPITGFTGDFYISLHIGESDNQVGTTRANMAAGIRNIAATFVANGSGTSRFFVATESMLTNVTNANITNGEADAVASGCSTCRAGANWDSIVCATNRQADCTHLAAAGLALAAAADVSVIQACHALGGSC